MQNYYMFNECERANNNRNMELDELWKSLCVQASSPHIEQTPSTVLHTSTEFTRFPTTVVSGNLQTPSLATCGNTSRPLNDHQNIPDTSSETMSDNTNSDICVNILNEIITTICNGSEYGTSVKYSESATSLATCGNTLHPLNEIDFNEVNSFGIDDTDYPPEWPIDYITPY